MRLDDLLGAMLGAPRLDGLCVGRHELFDLAEPNTDPAVAEYRERAALAICQRCPVLDACSSWFESLTPAKRPHGVVAGRVSRPRKARDGAA